MSKRPLDSDVVKAQRELDRAKALVAASEAKLQALLASQRALIGALVEENTLHAPKSTNIVPNMQGQTSAQKHSRRGRPRETTHPFPKALEAKGMTVTALAEKHEHDRARVKSWFAEGSGGRRIPRDIAEQIEKELGVPATLRTWKNGIA